MSDFTSKTSYAASAIVTLGGGITLNQAIALVGVILGIGTFLVNWRYKHLHYKLERDRNDAEKKCA